MDCGTARELISASIDGEASVLERRAADAHRRGCERCDHFAAGLTSPATAPNTDRPDPVLRFLRLALATVAVAMVAHGLPPILAHLAGDHSQAAASHLAAWDLAFAAALAVVAAQPYRVRGLLPMAALILAAMAVTIGLDFAGGHDPAMAASAHFLQLLGVVLLWQLQRVRFPVRTGHDPLSSLRLSRPH